MSIQRLQSISKKIAPWRREESRQSDEIQNYDEFRIAHTGLRARPPLTVFDGRFNSYYTPNLFNTWGFF